MKKPTFYLLTRPHPERTGRVLAWLCKQDGAAHSWVLYSPDVLIETVEALAEATGLKIEKEDATLFAA